MRLSIEQTIRNNQIKARTQQLNHRENVNHDSINSLWNTNDIAEFEDMILATQPKDNTIHHELEIPYFRP